MPEERAMRADARRNRDAIVAAARAVFDRDEQLRFDDFASRAGVGVGTLYRHFPTREALAAAVYHDEVTALCEHARASARPAGETLEAFLRGFADYVIAHAALARTLAALVAPDVQADGGGELERTVSELMARAAADGAIRDDVPPGAVMVVLHGIGSTADRPLWPAEARAAVELLIDGLKPV
ncbi:TetR/AcrR family transcriptional regulator [Microbacterium allomyrinae]|uniref:TetR/AcrR family transcriptional regulator n=1 Tax=Microbacterium allomyrinae TaxID=2830666 RepID=A0A9X1S2N5_9MICO|nr:TetR/AcrR family transcriptional regulator [Microbacterium allomyrinae]MCC2031587.1 TetR/AcrR family transcriptional regulator [Microbacterium allomyrinae]